MSITDRQELILTIVSERNYISVNDLAAMTFTSPSSIRRDLTYLQNKGLVERSHGGVTLPAPAKGVASLLDRMKNNIPAKRLIAKKASTLLRDGQNILLDGSSTVSFLLPYIAKLESATLFTNNISTVLSAIELGIDTHCIGGRSVNGSAALSGTEAYRAVSLLKPDILFFSSQSLDQNGIISDSTEEENYLRMLMLNAAAQKVFLCDSEKFNRRSVYTLTDLDHVDVAVFDREYEGLKHSCTVL
jgi:DeoR/GlpR family transcriptional regulator of sugar metabolism